MQTSAQRCARLVAALEDLAAQEEASLRAKDFAAVASLQARAGAVVADLVSRAGEVSAVLRARIIAVLEQRERSSARLAEAIAETREALRETDRSQRRVAQVAPVYGRAASEPRSQLCAVS